MAAVDRERDRIAEMKGFGSASSFGDLISDDESLLGDYDQVSYIDGCSQPPDALRPYRCLTVVLPQIHQHYRLRFADSWLGFLRSNRTTTLVHFLPALIALRGSYCKSDL